MIAKAVPERKDEARPLWQEAKELHLIFAKIYRGWTMINRQHVLQQAAFGFRASFGLGCFVIRNSGRIASADSSSSSLLIDTVRGEIRPKASDW